MQPVCKLMNKSQISPNAVRDHLRKYKLVTKTPEL